MRMISQLMLVRHAGDDTSNRLLHALSIVTTHHAGLHLLHARGGFSGRELTFLAPKGDGGSEFVWDFGDQSPPTSGERVSHRFEVAGTYVLTVSVRSGTAEVAKAVQEIRIELSPLERGDEKATKRRRRIDWALAISSLVVATMTGLSMLYPNRVFGTMANYLEAFVWGFGIDSSVRGLAAVAKKLTPE